MKKTNVLIFPSGAENALNVFDSLKYNLHFELFGATIKNDHSSYIYDKDHLSISEEYLINNPNFIKDFNGLLKKFNIDFVIPTHDEVSTFLIKNQGKINAKIICSDLKTCEIALDKRKTAEVLKCKSYYPKVYDIKTCESFPVFIKPAIGAGGKGARIINNKEELVEYNGKDYLCTEYLPGEEYTVDCFTDRNHNLLFIGPRTRERITVGVTFRSKRIPLSDEIKNIANDLNKVFSFKGAWFFQLKKDKCGKLKLMEICVRQAGTMAFYRQLGINFAALSLFDAMDMDISIIFNDYDIELDRYFKSCYHFNYDYDKIYVDYDDTLIVNGKINTDLIKYLYQSKNNNKEIVLLTKHNRNILESLDEKCINKNLFNKIVSLKEYQKKSDFIDTNKAIFIDNYFVERLNVKLEKNIPVFDVDAIECLINYKEL